MALDVNTFPLVISVQEDGQLVATISGIETLMTGVADRAGRAFQRETDWHRRHPTLRG